MPEKETLRRARRDKRQGKAATTQAGEFIREEFHHIREGKHGARSPEQAIAIGLSKARRSGVKVGTPKRGRVSAASRERIESDERVARQGGTRRKVSPRRSRAMRTRRQRENRAAASPRAIAVHSRRVAKRRSPAERRASAKKAARTRARRKHTQRSRVTARR